MRIIQLVVCLMAVSLLAPTAEKPTLFITNTRSWAANRADRRPQSAQILRVFDSNCLGVLITLNSWADYIAFVEVNGIFFRKHEVIVFEKERTVVFSGSGSSLENTLAAACSGIETHHTIRLAFEQREQRLAQKTKKPPQRTLTVEDLAARFKQVMPELSEFDDLTVVHEALLVWSEYAETLKREELQRVLEFRPEYSRQLTQDTSYIPSEMRGRLLLSVLVVTLLLLGGILLLRRQRLRKQKFH